MKLGNKIYSILILFYFSFSLLIADEKITSTPLINIDKITPSFEEIEEENENISIKQNIKEKKTNVTKLKSSQVVLVGLDKITAKSSKLLVSLNESKKFGPLEIKILKCGKVKVIIKSIQLLICKLRI